jgi:hypothetical protein
METQSEESTSTTIIVNEQASTSKIDDIISIPEFYNGRSIFITGGTGFMVKYSTNTNHNFN